MQSFIQLILDKLHFLWPVRIIAIDQQGVRRKRGEVADLLLPGVHWHIPGLHTVDKIQVAHQDRDCGTQSVDTLDGVARTLSANVGYVIKDAAKMSTAYYDFDTTLRNLVRGMVAEIILNTSDTQLTASLPGIVRHIRRALRKEFGPNGVFIRYVKLDEFTKTRQYRLFGTSSGPDFSLGL